MLVFINALRASKGMLTVASNTSLFLLYIEEVVILHVFLRTQLQARGDTGYKGFCHIQF